MKLIIAILISFTACFNVLANQQENIDYKPTIKAIIAACKSNDKVKIANAMRYPIDYSLGEIRTKKELVAHFDEVFDEKIITRFAKSNFEDWEEMGYKGIMFDRGYVWLYPEGMGMGYGTKKSIEIEKERHDKDANSLHNSVSKFKYNILVWKTKAHTIRIDGLGNGNYRYVAWSLDKKINEKPSLVLTNGVEGDNGTGPNRDYIFKSGPYTYNIALSPWCEGPKTIRRIEVYKDDKLIQEENAVQFCDNEEKSGCKALKK